MQRVFSERERDWAEKLDEVTILDADPPVTSLRGGIVLPVLRRALSEIQEGGAFDGMFEGGVADRRFRFAGGCLRSAGRRMANYSCAASYRPASVRHRSGTVVFGGVAYGHFGHMLTDGLSRMWWFARHADEGHTYVFVTMPGEDFEQARRILNLAGLDDGSIEVIGEPTSFDRVIVPGEAVYALDGRAHRCWLEFFDLLVERANASSTAKVLEKVYFTRARYPKKDGINEEFYERFFEAQGFEVVAPEELGLADQVRIVSNAEAIASTMGTISHCAVFARPGTRLVSLSRCSTIVVQQLLINESRGLDWAVFDAYLNPLPATQSRGAYLYGPTSHFSRFIEAAGIEQAGPDVTQEEVLRVCLYDYLELWTRVYSDEGNFKAICKKDIADVVENLVRLYPPGDGRAVQLKSYDRARIDFLSRQNERRLVRRVKRVLRSLGLNRS